MSCWRVSIGCSVTSSPFEQGLVQLGMTSPSSSTSCGTGSGYGVVAKYLAAPGIPEPQVPGWSTDIPSEIDGKPVMLAVRTRAVDRNVRVPLSDHYAQARLRFAVPGMEPAANWSLEEIVRKVRNKFGGHVDHAPEGGLVRRSNFRNRVWLPAIEAAGVAPLRIHDLRHTAVALAIAVGAHAKSIQARMGHSSVAMTLDRYVHLMEGLDAQVAARLEGLRRPQSSTGGGFFADSSGRIGGGPADGAKSDAD